MTVPPDEGDLTPDEALRLVAATTRQRWVWLIALVGVVLVEVLTVMLFHRDPPPRRPGGLIAVAIGYPVLLLGICGAAAKTLQRRLRRPGPARTLLLVADRRDIQRVSRLLQRGREITSADRPTAQAIVDLQWKQRRLMVVLLVLPLLLLVLVALDPHRNPFLWVYVALVIVLGPLGWWLNRRILRTAAAQGITPAVRE